MEVDDDTPHVTDYHSSNGNVKNSEVIETIDITNYAVSKKKSRCSSVYDKNLCKDNKPLTEFINKCIFLDSTKGMETVINKVLLPAYVTAESEYKNSGKFRKVITKAFERLTNDPDRKYTHISDVVETLKIHVSVLKPSPPPVKKRANFITLSTKVSVKTHEGSTKRPIIDSSAKVSPKKSKPEIIALDCDDDNEVIPIDDEGIESNISNQVREINLENGDAKDNLVNDDSIEIQDSQEIKIIDDDKENEHLTNKSINDKTAIDDKQENNEPTVNEHEKENPGSNENLCDDNKLLVPHKEKNVRLEKPKLKKKEPAKKPEEMTEVETAERIKIIEAKIEKCNKAIVKLDLEEVTDDSANSPYYKSDRLRATIVKLYKELCTLVGQEPPERRKIRLKIKEDVPQGPIKRVEKILNKQADAEGETPFPDFGDVISCVEKANENDGLGWSKAKVMTEAQAIFTYCGRALQKRRQHREWKHLRAMAKPEEFEADPAEQDLELQARLEANRQLAKQRETEVFSKFTRMEALPEPTASTSFQMDEPSEHEDSSSDEETELNQNTEATVLKESNNNDKVQNPTEATVLKESKNNDKTQNPKEPMALKENNNNDNIQYPIEATVLNESKNNDKIQNPKEPTALKENNNNDKIQYPSEATVLKECKYNDKIQKPTEATIMKESKNDDKIENPTEATALKEDNNNDNIVDTDDVVIKQEPEEVPIKIQYQGDISLVIEISDSESEDEYGELTF